MATSETELDNRDVFLGDRRCVICGIADPERLQPCYIVGSDYSDIETWTLLEQMGWAPAGVKASFNQRNGLLMCTNHHQAFKNWKFFIRFQPATKQYIFVHYDSCGVTPSLKQYHGKAVALNIEDMHAPLPLLFLVHENMARGMNFYQPITDVEVTNGWQKWMVVCRVVNEKDDGSFTFDRDAPTSLPPRQSRNLQAPSTTAGPSGSRTVIMPPTGDLVEELLAYQHTMPSWKMWEREEMERTAEENCGSDQIKGLVSTFNGLKTFDRTM